ncbi:hypothetical protein DMN91_008349 [Ooceraea biroi]|uniref:Uncharacterized protein n=1 Tax=Ooceraea biroi TaxID=2015173 RepID=A0A3L8DH62_OOCBI|nr:hypothetical protein DMN91_008349 [Ooceraea biroi]
MDKRGKRGFRSKHGGRMDEYLQGKETGGKKEEGGRIKINKGIQKMEDGRKSKILRPEGKRQEDKNHSKV